MRSNGGIIGGKKTVSTSAASGIWTIRDQQREIGANNWTGMPNGLTEERAAKSAYYIKYALGQNTTGYYWIKPTGSAVARQVWCDMTNSGGGWMLMSFAATGVSNGAHVKDAYTGSAFNASSSTINSSNGASSASGNLGQEFINSCVIAGRQRAVALFRMNTTNYYIPTDSASNWLPIAQRSRSQSGANFATFDAANLARTGNNWLKTMYTGYTADSGNNSAGTVSTSYAMGGDAWNTLPGNFNSIASNWGYSISQYYQSGDSAVDANFSTWPSSHHSGWGSSGYFWLKIGQE